MEKKKQNKSDLWVFSQSLSFFKWNLIFSWNVDEFLLCMLVGRLIHREIVKRRNINQKVKGILAQCQNLQSSKCLFWCCFNYFSSVYIFFLLWHIQHLHLSTPHTHTQDFTIVYFFFFTTNIRIWKLCVYSVCLLFVTDFFLKLLTVLF